MGSNAWYSWDDRKRESNRERHGYDFDDIPDITDGRPLLVRRDLRKEYGEERFNALATIRGRVVNVTYTPRRGKIHLISVRPASREERAIFHERTQD